MSEFKYIDGNGVHNETIDKDDNTSLVLLEISYQLKRIADNLNRKE